MDRKSVSEDFAQAYFQNVHGSKVKLPMNTNVFPQIIDERSVDTNKMTVLRFMFVMWDELQSIYGDMNEFGMVISTIVTHYDMNYPYFDMYGNETLGVHTIQDYADFLNNILNILSPGNTPSSSATPVQFIQQGLNVPSPILWNPDRSNPITDFTFDAKTSGLNTRIGDIVDEATDPIRLDFAIEKYLKTIGIDLVKGQSLDEMFLNNPEEVNDPMIEEKLSNMLKKLRSGDISFMKKAFQDHLKHQFPVSVQFNKGSKKKNKDGSIVAIIVTKTQTVTAIDLNSIDFKGGISGISTIDHTTINTDAKRVRQAKELANSLMGDEETIIVISEDTIGTNESVKEAITELKEIVDGIILTEDVGTERSVHDHLSGLKNIHDRDIPDDISEDFGLLIKLAKNEIVQEQLLKVTRETAKLRMLSLAGIKETSSLAGDITKIGGRFNLANLWAKTAKDTVDAPNVPPFLGIFIDTLRNHDFSSSEDFDKKITDFITAFVSKSASFPDIPKFIASMFRPNFMAPATPRNLKGFSANGMMSIWNGVIHDDLGRNDHANLISSYDTFTDALEDAQKSEDSDLAGQIIMRYYGKWVSIAVLWVLSAIIAKGGYTRKAIGYVSMAALLLLYLEHSLVFALPAAGYTAYSHQQRKKQLVELNIALGDNTLVRRHRVYRDVRDTLKHGIPRNQYPTLVRKAGDLIRSRNSLNDRIRDLGIFTKFGDVSNVVDIEITNSWDERLLDADGYIAKFRNLLNVPLPEVPVPDVIPDPHDEVVDNDTPPPQRRMGLRNRAANLLSVLDS